MLEELVVRRLASANLPGKRIDGLPEVWHDDAMAESTPGDLLVTVAPTGAETSKADCPPLPTTLSELVRPLARA
jgi:hypothetical protein